MKPYDAQDDAALRALLREASPEPPMDDVVWKELHARILDRAAPLVRGRGGAWWRVLADWSRGAPAAAASAAVLLLVVLGGLFMPDRLADGSGVARLATIEEVLAADLDDSAAPLLLAGDDRDDVLDALFAVEDER